VISWKSRGRGQTPPSARRPLMAFVNTKDQSQPRYEYRPKVAETRFKVNPSKILWADLGIVGMQKRSGPGERPGPARILPLSRKVRLPDGQPVGCR